MIISQLAVAKKYATAYLNVYEETLTLDDVNNMCKAVTFLRLHSNFMLLVCEVGMYQQQTTELLKKLCKHFSFPQSMHNLIKVLTKYKNICCLLDVLQDICCLYKVRKNVLELKIKSAQDVDDITVKQLELFFEQQTQKQIVSTVQVDQSLIAGVRLQSNYFLWEYSIASRLRKLRQKLLIEG